MRQTILSIAGALLFSGSVVAVAKLSATEPAKPSASAVPHPCGDTTRAQGRPAGLLFN